MISTLATSTLMAIYDFNIGSVSEDCYVLTHTIGIIQQAKTYIV